MWHRSIESCAGLEELRNAAIAIGAGAKKEYSTLFEAKQAESQALYKNAHKGSIVKSDAAPVNTGLSFHEAQQQKAQKTASSATNYGTRSIVQSGAGQVRIPQCSSSSESLTAAAGCAVGSVVR